MRLNLSLLILAGLLALDLATKYILTTPEWAWHPRTSGWQLTAVVCAVLFSLLLMHPVTRLPGAVLIAGSLGNLIDSFNPQGIHNPFVMYRDDIQTAFNLADVYLASAVFTFLGALAIRFLTHPQHQIRDVA